MSTICKSLSSRKMPNSLSRGFDREDTAKTGKMVRNEDVLNKSAR